MKKSKNQKIGKISLYLSFGLIVLFIFIVVAFFPRDTRDRLLIFDYTSNYTEAELITFPANIGSIEFSYPSNDPRIQLSTFPTYIIVSHDRKKIKFITDKKDKLNEYYRKEKSLQINKVE